MRGYILNKFNSYIRGLVGYWPCDDGNASRMGDLLQGNHGVPTDISWISVNPDFNGTSSEIIIADNALYRYLAATPKTLSLWFKPHDVAGVQTIVSKWDGNNQKEYIVYLNTTTLTAGVNNSPAVLTSAGISANQLYHLVMTMDENQYAEIFLDGVSKDTGTSAGGFQSDPSVTVRLGQNSDTNWFHGEIYDFMIFDRTLTEADVDRLYRDTKELFIEAEPTFRAHAPVEMTRTKNIHGMLLHVE